MTQPYIGVTGFMTSNEVLYALSCVPESSHRKLMVGVLGSQKTIFMGSQNRWPNRYPDPGDIGSIFQRHPSALNLVHYNTKNPETLLRQMLMVTQLGGPNFQGFQLNVAWPLPQALEAYRGAYPEMHIVLQVGGGAFKEISDSPENLAERVADEYVGLIDYLLLDPSGGFGKPFDPTRAREYLEALEARNLDIGLGVAGGLSSTTLDLVELLADDFPDLSIDAESRLRDEDDTLDLDLTGDYIRTALQIF